MSELESVWCVIPVYNNAATVRDVVLGCRKILPNVLVVDDGSTDADLLEILKGSGITVLKHHENRGKGKAIMTALDYVSKKKARYMISIDGDGQHSPQDLEKFFPLLETGEDSLVIGCRDFSRPNIPGKSRFGRDFANFWLRLETGVSVRDCQSGFRAYPVKHFKALSLNSAYYDFETEALARAAWAGLNLKMVDVDVFYPEKEKRVSHFRPFMDNLRISLMHTKLVLRHLLPLPHKKLVQREIVKINFSVLIFHPVRSIKNLLKENSSPAGLAASAAVGVILGTLPLVFVHTIAILYVTSRLHLNKIMAVSIQNISNPPFVPFLCVELGHRMRYGSWLTSVTPQNFLGQVPELFVDWLIGSLVAAPLLTLIVSPIVYFTAKFVREKSRKIFAAESGL